jgi:hypothetical protein
MISFTVERFWKIIFFIYRLITEIGGGDAALICATPRRLVEKGR